MTDLEKYILWGSTDAAMDQTSQNKYEDDGQCSRSAHTWKEDIEGSAKNHHRLKLKF